MSKQLHLYRLCKYLLEFLLQCLQLLQNQEFLGFAQTVYVVCTEFHEFRALVLSALFFLPQYSLEV